MLIVQDTPVIFPRLHHDGKVGHLGGTVVNIQTEEIVFQNASGSVPLSVAGTLVDLHQNGKSIDQYMPRTHTGIDHGDLFRGQL